MDILQLPTFNTGNSHSSRVSIIPYPTLVHDSNAIDSRSLQKETIDNRQKIVLYRLLASKCLLNIGSYPWQRINSGDFLTILSYDIF